MVGRGQQGHDLHLRISSPSRLYLSSRMNLRAGLTDFFKSLAGDDISESELTKTVISEAIIAVQEWRLWM